MKKIPPYFMEGDTMLLLKQKILLGYMLPQYLQVSAD